jgi:hypothetical protein
MILRIVGLPREAAMIGEAPARSYIRKGIDES